MTDDWRDRMEERMGKIEQRQGIYDDRWLRVEPILTETRELLRSVDKRLDFLDGANSTKGKIWGGVIVLLAAVIGGSGIFTVAHFLVTGKWN